MITRVSILSAVLLATLAAPFALAGQQANPPSTTPPPAAAPPPGTVPVTSQTPAGPGVDPTAPTAVKKSHHKKHSKAVVPAPQQPAPQ